MKDFLLELDKLIAYKRLNRETLAVSIGINRQNLIAALKGRRTLPPQYVNGLLTEAGLNASYSFDVTKVHGITVFKGDEQAEDLLDLLKFFLTEPLRQRWLLEGIGERAIKSKALAMEDARGAFILVRNDDGKLFQLKTEAAYYFDTTDLPVREVPLALFQRLFDPGFEPITADECRIILAQNIKIWTWTRVIEQARKRGLDAAFVAEKLCLDHG